MTPKAVVSPASKGRNVPYSLTPSLTSRKLACSAWKTHDLLLLFRPPFPTPSVLLYTTNITTTTNHPLRTDSVGSRVASAPYHQLGGPNLILSGSGGHWVSFYVTRVFWTKVHALESGFLEVLLALRPSVCRTHSMEIITPRNGIKSDPDKPRVNSI